MPVFNKRAAALTAALFAGAVLPVSAQYADKETIVHDFGGLLGRNPETGLTFGPAGDLYGTAAAGGAGGLGVVFTLDASGAQTVLHAFAGGADGAEPNSAVIFDSAGNLYGTTYRGGAANVGVVYKIDTAGVESVVYSFAGGADGAFPEGLVADASGNLYGATLEGGAANVGVVFKVDATGKESVLYAFQGGADGRKPFAGLAFNASGNLVGTTSAGGAYGFGAIFQVTPGGAETVLYSFKGHQYGSSPNTVLAAGPNGDLYGAAGEGPKGGGIIYRLTTSGVLSELYAFSQDGYQPALPSRVTLDAAGNLYGTVEYADNSAGYVFKLDMAGNLTTLFAFPVTASGNPGGANPEGGVIRDAAGNLYGTTAYGGPRTAFGDYGNGVIFKVDPAGSEKLLFTFTNDAGMNPQGTLIFDALGNMYGTAGFGGGAGQGVVYKIDAGGVYSVLHWFAGGEAGGEPVYGVVRDPAGNLYGVTEAGTDRRAVVFKITAAGGYSVLHRFAENAPPSSGVAIDAGGNLYGTTSPTRTCAGSIYKIDAAGNYTTLYAFDDTAFGCRPLGNLILDAAGNLYGTTNVGGASGSGTVYKVSPAGQETVLYSFNGTTDGAFPNNGVTMDAAGNLYGTNNYALYGSGVVFKLDTAGQFSVLNTIPSSLAGSQNFAVVLDAAGNVYGSNSMGYDYGTVYEVEANGDFVDLFIFPGGAYFEEHGTIVSSGMIQDAKGNLYGTTLVGGRGGHGVVFKLEPASPAN